MDVVVLELFDTLGQALGLRWFTDLTDVADYFFDMALDGLFVVVLT